MAPTFAAGHSSTQIARHSARVDSHGTVMLDVVLMASSRLAPVSISISKPTALAGPPSGPGAGAGAGAASTAAAAGAGARSSFSCGQWAGVRRVVGSSWISAPSKHAALSGRQGTGRPAAPTRGLEGSHAATHLRMQGASARLRQQHAARAAASSRLAPPERAAMACCPACSAPGGMRGEEMRAGWVARARSPLLRDGSGARLRRAFGCGCGARLLLASPPVVPSVLAAAWQAGGQARGQACKLPLVRHPRAPLTGLWECTPEQFRPVAAT